MSKRLIVTALAALFTLSVYTSGAQAGKTGNVIAGIAIGVAATALIIGAARSANAHRNNQYYGYNHGISKKENAVAACIHAADWEVRRKRRGLYTRLDRVKKIKKRQGRLKVTMLVTNFYRTGHRQRWVKCHVKHDRVVFFKYN